MLTIRDLHAGIEDTDILNGVDLDVPHDEVTVIMGPNGSGKSTLAHVIMGNPKFDVYDGSIEYRGENVLDLETDERAQLGLFLSFQYPKEVPGVTMSNFLRTALNARRDDPINVGEFRERLSNSLDLLDMDQAFMNRYLNDGFSGGEKKRAEILQMSVLQPNIAILDETDSGLDIDALKVVANGVNQQVEQRDDLGVLIITHYQRLLNYITPDTVHVMIDGKIAESGGPELAEKLEEEGYDWIT
jgi:Fe-S cluster assembly ATP-binding protein